MVTKMKKILRYVLLVLITALIVYFALKIYDDRQNNIYFELSHAYNSSEGVFLLPDDGYFALTKDNMLVWTYGNGSLYNGTYGNYFFEITEKGRVILTEQEAKDLVVHIKKVTKCRKPVKSDYVLDMNDYDEFFIKVGNKFYDHGNKTLKHKLTYEEMELRKKDPLHEYSFLSVEKEILDIIESYHQKYREDAKEAGYISDGDRLKIYYYDAFQNSQMKKQMENN